MHVYQPTLYHTIVLCTNTHGLSTIVWMYTHGQRFFIMKDIILTRNRVIQFCIQKPTAPPIYAQ